MELGAGRALLRTACRGGPGSMGDALTSRRNLLVGYFIWLALLIAAYYLRPALRTEAWGLIGLTGVLAIVAGIVINRPARKAPWLLLVVANLSFGIGQVSFLVLTQIMKVTVPFPSFADGFYLAQYPLAAVGFLIFIWWRTPDRDRRSLIDALTLTVGLGLLSWIYLILPYVHNPSLSWLQKSVAVGYPLGDVLLLAMIARLIVPGTARSRSVQFLILGTVGMLASDVSFGAIQLYGSFHTGTVVDLGWAVCYTAWGAAALHPSMTELTQPVTRQTATGKPAARARRRRPRPTPAGGLLGSTKGAGSSLLTACLPDALASARASLLTCPFHSSDQARVRCPADAGKHWMKWVTPRPHAAPAVSGELPDRTLILGGAQPARPRAR